MNIGISNIVTANGSLIELNWNTFNPDHASGKVHEILAFNREVKLSEVFTVAEECVVRSEYACNFELFNSNEKVEQYKAIYSITLNADQSSERIRSFLFLSDGEPWALCTMNEDVFVQPNIPTKFRFESSIFVYNAQSLVKAVTKSKPINYAVKVGVMPYQETDIVSTIDGRITGKSTDLEILDILESTAQPFNAQLISQDGKVGFEIEPASRLEVKGIKALFIRILWNMGVLIYFKDTNIKDTGVKEGLTIDRGQYLKLLFSLNLKEVKDNAEI